jgi:hypothetical protein
MNNSIYNDDGTLKSPEEIQEAAEDRLESLKDPAAGEDHKLAMREADDASMEELEAAGEIFDLLTKRGEGYRRMGETLMPNRQRVGGDPIPPHTPDPRWKRALKRLSTHLAIWSLEIGRFLAHLGRASGTVVDCVTCKEDGIASIAVMTCRQCLMNFCESCWQFHSSDNPELEILKHIFPNVYGEQGGEGE